MEKCDRCGDSPSRMGTLVRVDGRKLCGTCRDLTSDGSTLVGTTRIPIFSEV